MKLKVGKGLSSSFADWVCFKQKSKVKAKNQNENV